MAARFHKESKQYVDRHGKVFYTTMVADEDGVVVNPIGTKTPVKLSPLAFDAWDRPKAILDKSLFHCLFTNSVPKDKWYEQLNGVELPAFNKTVSTDGKLVITSGSTINDVVTIRTLRNPPYQPNRGHLYSTSAFLPSPEAIGIRDFGCFTEESGYFFRLEDGVLYACLQTTLGGTIQPTEKFEITDLPVGLDLANGNNFDIQMQWRGVGNYKFFINDTLVHTINKLGNSTQLTIFNPALPLSYRTISTDGTDVEIQVGCTDLTTEGGSNLELFYGSVSTPGIDAEVTISGSDVPFLVFHNKSTLPNGRINTRDIMFLRASAYADQKSVIRVWVTRDSTAVSLGTQVFESYNGDGDCEYVYYDPLATTPMTFDDTKARLAFANRVEKDVPYTESALFEEHANIILTPGTYYVFTMHRQLGQITTAGLTFEFARDI